LEAVPFQKTAQNRMLPITSLAGFLPQTVSVAKRPSIAQIRIPEVSSRDFPFVEELRMAGRLRAFSTGQR
jgi:hypothetical protein